MKKSQWFALLLLCIGCTENRSEVDHIKAFLAEDKAALENSMHYLQSKEVNLLYVFEDKCDVIFEDLVFGTYGSIYDTMPDSLVTPYGNRFPVSDSIAREVSFLRKKNIDLLIIAPDFVSVRFRQPEQPQYFLTRYNKTGATPCAYPVDSLWCVNSVDTTTIK